MSTIFGGVCCKPNACRIIDRTITFLTNVVVAIKIKGIKLNIVREIKVEVGFNILMILLCCGSIAAKQLKLIHMLNRAINILRNALWLIITLPITRYLITITLRYMRNRNIFI